MNHISPQTEKISFAARDGYPLVGTLKRPLSEPIGGLLITAGTGFEQRFYSHFADYAAERGFIVFTFDARGIGQSSPEDLSTFEMHYTQWGRHDTPAALDALAAAAPDLPLVHVAHSVGGHFLGLWDNHDRVSAHVFTCVGSGYWRDHKPGIALAASYLWHIYGPYSLKRHGYVKKGGGWSGASLPRGVFEPWKQWCNQPRYFLNELNTDDVFKGHSYNDVTRPITSMIYTDDQVASPKTGQVMLDLYPNAKTEMLVRSPDDYSLKAIGHNGPFKKAAKAAQDEIIDILLKNIAG